LPLTEMQQAILALLAETRAPDSYLAGGAALHFAPNSVRYSNDLDFFHDSAERVASAFSEDTQLLEGAGYSLDVEISQPGFIRAVVSRDGAATRIDWAHDSAWRFMPLVRDPMGGFLLHAIDLAVNKALVLAGRDEPRDFIDILFVHERVLALSALTWAAVGKDPGFTPLSLIELLKRRGRPRPEEMARLNLAVRYDPVKSKELWRNALEDAEAFARSRPAGEVGCLYYSSNLGTFVVPDPDADLASQGLVVHFGAPFGVLPQAVDLDDRAPSSSLDSNGVSSRIA
jgi:Nucleotidyl transferase AbiEii toxin, Type IV TA system